MTHADLVTAIRNSADNKVEIEGGKPGTEDYDTGSAWLEDDGSVTVGWESGVRTTMTPEMVDEYVNLI